MQTTRFAPMLPRAAARPAESGGVVLIRHGTCAVLARRGWLARHAAWVERVQRSMALAAAITALGALIWGDSGGAVALMLIAAVAALSSRRGLLVETWIDPGRGTILQVRRTVSGPARIMAEVPLGDMAALQVTRGKRRGQLWLRLRGGDALLVGRGPAAALDGVIAALDRPGGTGVAAELRHLRRM